MKDKRKRAFLKYGIPSDFAEKLVSYDLTLTAAKVTSIANLRNKYGLEYYEAKLLKQYVLRQPIEKSVLNVLLLNNNFTCCCCLGQKGKSFIVHHIEEYEVSQNNSYNNLAVLCPTCHDLAHSQRALTLTISKEQLIMAKKTWEESCIGKRQNVAIPRVESWQAEFSITVDNVELNYLCDLTISKNAEVTNGYFNVIYLNRGNIFMAGEFSHSNSGVDADAIVEFWGVQWGLRVSEKSRAKVILNYGFHESVFMTSTDGLLDPIPYHLEFKLVDF